MADYSKVDYWEERYANHPELFDWYQIYQNLKDYISLLLNKNDAILNVGAGTSSNIIKDFYQYFINFPSTKYYHILTFILN
jgi:hypothetical protein